MKIKVGDSYKLVGACQYGYTRDGIEITINYQDVITKIKDTFSDRLCLRSMYRIDKTGWEIDMDKSIIERCFIKEKVKTCAGCIHLEFNSGGVAECVEETNKRCHPYSRIKYEESQ